MREPGPDLSSPASAQAARAAHRRLPFAVDVVLFTPRGRQLVAYCVRAADPRARELWHLPSDWVMGEETLEDAARRVVRQALGLEPAWIEQAGAFGSHDRHPLGAELSVAFVAVIPAPAAGQPDGEGAWFSVSEPPALPPRHRAILGAALGALRSRMDQTPIAFRLLPPQFTLSELQQMYELLLGRRLHKASFRRALQGAALVEATDEWRSEGRGRPAQFYRFAPRKRRVAKRGVRFDLL